jgi:hypothetical protein
MQVTKMLQAHSQATPDEALALCIEACFACAMTCTSCADACVAEEDVRDLVHCVRLNLDCADLCDATARMLTRQTSSEPRLVRSTLEACSLACRLCAEECERHADLHEHCRVCAETCRRCEQACVELLGSIGG